MRFENPNQIEAAREISATIVSKLSAQGGVHAATAIAAASRMAGTLLLTASGLPLRQFRPGSNILSDRIDRQGRELMGAVSEALASLPLHMDTSKPDYYIPDASMPRLELRDTQQLLAREFRNILARHRLTEAQGAYAAAIASALLIQECAAVLDPKVGRAIATIGIVEASKTVPLAPVN
jgi:hypothetical protein